MIYQTENRSIHIVPPKEEREIIMKKIEQSFKQMATIKCTNILIMGVPEGEDKEQGVQKQSKMMVKIS